MSADVELQNISINFGDFYAAKNVSVMINKGEFFSFLGPSGCGKTTIYNTLTEAWSGIPGQLVIKMIKMNPKAIKGQEMYGVMNNIS